MKSLKRIMAVALVLLAIGSLAVFAESANTEYHIGRMLSLIENQNFENTLGVDYVKGKIKYIMNDSKYAASKTSYFPYPNSSYVGFSSVTDTVDNKTVTVSIRGTTWGCMTYARYVNTVVNGSDPQSYNFLEQSPGDVTGEGLKEFLLTYGQAGEHLRIDSTHSVAYVSGDEEGFYYFNYNNDAYPFITMEYETYDDFAERYKNTPVNYSDGVPNVYAIWLYQSNCNVNEKKPAVPPAPPTPAVVPGASVPAPVVPGATVPGTTVPECIHEKYDSCGYCKNCGKAFPMEVISVSPVEYTVIKSVPVRIRPYAVVTNVKRFELGEKVTVVGYAYNSYGKLWYQVKSEGLGANAFWIYSDNIARVNTVKIELTDTTNIGESSLTVNGICTYTTQCPDRVSLYVGTNKNEMTRFDGDTITHNANPFKIWYKLTGIKKDTVYYYRLVAEYDNIEYEVFFDKQSLVSKLGTFMIASDKAEIPQPEKPDTKPVDDATAGLLDAIVPVKLNVKSVTSLAQTSARFNASCTYIETRPSYVCLYLGLSADTGKMWQVGYDTINHTKNPFDIWYDVSGMAENTVYYYQFRAEADGKIYTSDVHTVTTMNKAPIDNAMDTALGALGMLANTRTGVISGTDLLAINDKAAASPTYSTMIGTAPAGASVTVYPDKQSGNWYYISYNGVSGYAYGKYITLK